MSIVAKQSFKYTIIGYLGFLLGTFSAVFVFPLNLEFYGKLRFIMNSAEIITPFIILGISYANVKFFYQSQRDNKHHNLLSISLLVIGINFILFLFGFILMPIIFPKIKNLEIWEYKFYVIPLVLILSICAIFNKFISNYKRIAISNIFDNLFPKLANILSFSLFFFLGIAQSISFLVFISFFFISMVGYIIYTNNLEKINYDFSTQYLQKNNLWRAVASYSFFSFLGTFGNQLNINNQMIGEFMSMKEVGVYSILYSLISLISIPQLGLFNVSAPIINQSLSEKKYADLDKFYKKTSLSLFFLGAILFSCIVTGFPYLASMMKNGKLLLEFQSIIWIWGTAVLFDLATGFNGNIISLSKYYKFNILMMLIFALFTIGLNYYFIKYTELKLIGIAISTAISTSIYNGIKVLFNYWKFKVSPFSIEMIFASIICSIAASLALIFPNFKNPLINMIYKPLLVLICIFIGNTVIKIVDLKDFYKKLLNKKS